MKEDSTGKRVLKLVPPGKRRPEGPKGTGRSKEEKLIKTSYKGNTSTIGRAVQDRSQWRGLVAVLGV